MWRMMRMTVVAATFVFSTYPSGHAATVPVIGIAGTDGMNGVGGPGTNGGPGGDAIGYDTTKSTEY